MLFIQKHVINKLAYINFGMIIYKSFKLITFENF
jgi:hypothetical protein